MKKYIEQKVEAVLKRSSCGGGDSFSPQPADVSYSLALLSSSSLNTSLLGSASQPEVKDFVSTWIDFIVFFS